jgi:hypothetical protein
MLALFDFHRPEFVPHVNLKTGERYCGLVYLGLASPTAICFAHEEGKQRPWGQRNTERLLMRVRQIAAEHGNQVDSPEPIVHLFPMEDASALPRHRERLRNR